MTELFPCGHEKTEANTYKNVKPVMFTPATLARGLEHSRAACRKCKAGWTLTMFNCGHQRTPENTFVSPTYGHKRCLECRNASRSKSKKKKVPKAKQVNKPVWPKLGPPERKSGVEAPATPEWRERALCRGSNTDDFYRPDRPKPTTRAERVAMAAEDEAQINAVRKVCNACPVRQLCVAEGIEEPHGYWGGTTPSQRYRFRSSELDWDQLLASASRLTQRGPDKEKVATLEKAVLKHGPEYNCGHKRNLENTLFVPKGDGYIRLRCAECDRLESQRKRQKASASQT